MVLEFSGTVFIWRGPAPWFFVGTGFTISLFPKDGLYLVRVKASVRKIEEGDEGAVRLEVR